MANENKITEPNNPNTIKNKNKFSTGLIEKFKGRSEHIKTAILPPNNKKAWEKFSDEDKNEMLESREKKDSVDLKAISIPTDMLKFEPSRKGGERLKIKEGFIQKDSIGKYFNITVGGNKLLKCREWQPGITGLAYTIIPGDRYNRNIHQIKIGFYKEGKERKSTINTYDYPM